MISGLAPPVIIVEEYPQSNDLNTGEFPAAQGREMSAVPVNISSDGANQHIRYGVLPVLSTEGVLEGLSSRVAAEHTVGRTELLTNTTDEGMMAHLNQQLLHVDELCVLTILPITRVSSMLAMMESKGLLWQVDGMHYVVARKLQSSVMVD